ncbi:MAG: DUF1080 domain-containing protein [Verrucomicrobiota bacterium]
MKQNLFLALALLLGMTACRTAQINVAESGFTSLFDGETLAGWTAGEKKGETPYFVRDGAIVCPAKGGGNLLTEKEYSDFVLRLDFKLTPGANNGIAIRSPLGGGDLTFIGNEIQILDDNAPEYRDLLPGQNCGSLYRTFYAKRGAVKPAGEWNRYEITAMGRQIRIVLNGKKIAEGNINEVRDPELLGSHPGLLRAAGHIGFLGHNSEVEFRNIRIKETAHFYERDNVVPVGFAALFNGRDLSGWKGLVGDPPQRAKMSPAELSAAQKKADQRMRESWTVENGALVFSGKGESLCTAKDYGDFELLVDWKILPKGDSGIYLRGSPQVQIWEPNSGGVDPKHPGSGGLYNNQKNQNFASKMADHYVGEWNRFRILMVGEKVHVFLNNELVVNNVTMENYWERDKPIYPFGQIELQNHGNTLWFKNIFLREIPRVENKKK